MLKKSELREIFLRKRDEISEKNRHKESVDIMKAILDCDEYKLARTVFVYVSYKSEVCTKELILRMLKDKKTVLVPLCDRKTHTMKAVKISDISDLKVGAYGILEPYDNKDGFNKAEIDLIIVPAITFDKRGMRLGYGAGYYDRFLADFDGDTIGLCFYKCLLDTLPVDEFDKPVKKIITGVELIDNAK